MNTLDILHSAKRKEEKRSAEASNQRNIRVSLINKGANNLLFPSASRHLGQADDVHSYKPTGYRKVLKGTNFFEIGFAKETKGNRLVVICTLDNLVKGSAGNAVQSMNLMWGFPETAGLEFPGLYPA